MKVIRIEMNRGNFSATLKYSPLRICNYNVSNTVHAFVSFSLLLIALFCFVAHTDTRGRRGCCGKVVCSVCEASLGVR